MAQQLLNRLDIFAIRLHQSAERVSQRMPPHVARNLCRFERRLEMGAKKRPRPIRLFALLVWTGKHPIARLGIGSLELPIQQDLGQFRVERDWLARSFRLAAGDLLLDHGTSDVYL